MKKNTARHKFALKLALLHFFISILVASLSAIVVWKLWYAYPFSSILQVGGLFKVIIVVDIICGPLLTLILANPKKSRLETTIDLSTVAAIQLAALLYGLHALYIARPVAVAFEKDRFVIVTANEISETHARELPITGVEFFNVREPKDGAEKSYIIDLYLRDLSTTSIPSWWLPYESALPQIKARSKPVNLLLTARPESQARILQLTSKHKRPISDLRFLPIVHPKDMTWIAILDSNHTIIDYLNIDGFI